MDVSKVKLEVGCQIDELAQMKIDERERVLSALVVVLDAAVEVCRHIHPCDIEPQHSHLMHDLQHAVLSLDGAVPEKGPLN